MEKIDIALRLYEEDKLLQSARVLEQVKTHLADLQNDPTPDKYLLQTISAIQSRLNHPDLLRISEQVEEVKALKASFESKDGWTLSYDGAQSKVWYRKEEGTTSHSMLVEGEINAPLINLAALMYEADLYTDLLWFVNHAVILDEPSRLRRAAYFALCAPWPLYDRDVAIFGYAVDALDEHDHCVLVVSRSLRASDAAPAPPAPPGGKRHVRADVHLAGYELGPIAPGRTRVRCAFNVDPKLPIVPTALVNWAARTICRWSLRAMETRARTLPPAYHARMKTGPIYDWFALRLLQYWTRMGRLDEYEGSPEEASADRRDSGNFDINAAPEAPSRSVISSLLALQGMSAAGGEPSAGKGKSFASRFFFGGGRE